MAITAAAIEANGWVLRVTHTAGPGSFASYVLDPNTSPGLTLSAVSAGFAPSGGTIAVGAPVRTLTATKPLRKPVQATSAGVRSAKAIDETANGDGTVTVRIALSQHVYATDAGLSLSALAGWRTGESAQTIAVTNTSALAAPQPLVRWSDVPYQLKEGSFDLEVVVVAQHPVGLAPVAGVKFTVTDGTTIKTYWATALSTSTVYSAGGTGQGVRVYKVTVDPTTATALTRGLLRCDYKVFPWIGPARVSDTADTNLTSVAGSNAAPSMTGLATAGLAAAAQVPFVVAYNAGGTWITKRYAYVVADGSGASTASANLVSTSATTAAATPCNGINIALESLRLHAVANTGTGTIVAANGQASITQSVDACIVRLKAGTGVHPGAGTLAVTSGIQSLATWVVVEGDPADGNPRANVVLRAPSSANGATRQSRVQFRRMTVETGTLTVFTTSNIWIDDVEMRAVPGSELAAAAIPFTSNGGYWVTSSRWWRCSVAPIRSGTQQIPVLVRNCDVERAIMAPVVLNNRRLPSAIAGTNGITGDGTASNPSTDAARALDRIAIGNDLRYINGGSAIGFSTLANASAPAAPAPGNALGSTYPVSARQAFINTVCEAYGTASPIMYPAGENNPAVLTETIVEGTTFTGDRANMDYNDLNLATIALNDCENSIALVNRRANNIFHKWATKHDFFNDPAVQAQRQGTGTYSLATSRNKAKAVGDELTANGNIYRCTTAGTTATSGGPSGTGASIADGTATWAWFAVADARQHGYRPQALASWSALYGVGDEGNVDLQPTTDIGFDGEFNFEFPGMRSVQLGVSGINLTASPFVSDNSGTTNKMPWQAPSGTGGGDYRIVGGGASGAGLSASYVLGHGINANSDVFQSGAMRPASFAAGALDTVAVGLLPAGARHATSSRVGLISWYATLVAASARSASRATVSAARWSVALAPHSGRSATRARAAFAGWTTTVPPARSALASRASVSVVIVTARLTPANTRHRTTDVTRPIMLPASSTPPERTLIVTGDFRLTIAG